MAKTKESSKETPVEASKSQREVLWEKFVANYKLANPVKYESKLARGEFKNIPTSFKGEITIVKGKEVIV